MQRVAASGLAPMMRWIWLVQLRPARRVFAMFSGVFKERCEELAVDAVVVMLFVVLRTSSAAAMVTEGAGRRQQGWSEIRCNCARFEKPNHCLQGKL